MGLPLPKGAVTTFNTTAKNESFQPIDDFAIEPTPRNPVPDLETDWCFGSYQGGRPPMHWPNPDNFAPCNPTPRSGERGSRLFEFSLGAGLVLLATCTERYRGSVTVFVLPLFSHFGGATANRQAPAPITAKEAAQKRWVINKFSVSYAKGKRM